MRVANEREDFLNKVSRSLVLRYSKVVVEDLNVKGMMGNRYLARNIGDASWNTFAQMLSYKAVECGGQLIKVNPRGTSKTCSGCGNIEDMPLHKREFQCSVCNFVCDRDVNAAVNILQIGLDRPELTPVDKTASAPSILGVSGLEEAGTKCQV